MDKIKYLSLFSGIGGFEVGIIQSKYGGLFENIGYSEIDKYAKSIYEKNFPDHINWGDATRIRTEELPDFDFLVGGFPCQAFSVAGKRGGFSDTRGTLFFEIARILRDKRPRYFLLENVKGLLSHDKGKTFQTILEVLTDLGYYVKWEVHNSKNYGVPQNRERIFIKGYLGRECGGEVLLETRDSTEDTGKVDNRSINREWVGKRNGVLNKTDGLIGTLTAEGQYSGGRQFITENDDDADKIRKIGNVFDGGGQAGNVYHSEGLGVTLSANGGGAGGKTGMYLVPCTKDGDFFAVTTGNRQSPLKKRQDNYVLEPQCEVEYIKYPVVKRKYTLTSDELDSLKELLIESRKESGLSVKEISSELDEKKTLVEHYFRKDKYWSTPSPNSWMKLKDLLNITTDKYDDYLTVFETVDGVYDMSNRVYDCEGLSPTLNTAGKTLIKTSEMDENILKYFSDVDSNRCMTTTKDGDSLCVVASPPQKPVHKQQTNYVIEECIGSTQEHATRTDGSYTPTLTEAMGKGGGHVPMIKYSANEDEDNRRINKVGNVYKDSGSNGDVYSPDGLSPTILTGTKEHKIIEEEPQKVGNVYENNHWSGNVYDTNHIAPTLLGQRSDNVVRIKEENSAREINKIGNISKTGEHQSGDIYSQDGLSPTLCCTDYKNPVKIMEAEEETVQEFRIRRLTPLECERLQAFPDYWTKYGKDDELISDTQRYKCCGNAVTTTVITYLIEDMFDNILKGE